MLVGLLEQIFNLINTLECVCYVSRKKGEAKGGIRRKKLRSRLLLLRFYHDEPL